jgi:hypothetical protein
MNGKQRAVLWIGLILVALNLAKRWSDIRAIIFTGAGGVSSSNPNSGGISTVPGIGAPASGGVTLPFGGFPITVPLGNLPSFNIGSRISQQQQDVSGRVATRSPTGNVSGSRL